MVAGNPWNSRKQLPVQRSTDCESKYVSVAAKCYMSLIKVLPEVFLFLSLASGVPAAHLPQGQ